MAKILPNLPPPLDKHKVYGPYTHAKEGRLHVTIFKDEYDRTSMSYARYLGCIKVGRILGKDEEADHIDNDKTNDSAENIQILTPAENRLKHFSRLSRRMVDLQCPHCRCEFTRERRQTHLIKGGTRTFCSRRCARQVQAKEKAKS